jgi:hypothetical protein
MPIYEIALWALICMDFGNNMTKSVGSIILVCNEICEIVGLDC